jgi:hypothetical protein
MLFSTDTKNTLAKFAVLLWIAFLIFAALFVARQSISFDINEYFGFQGSQLLPASVVQEIRLIILMLSVSILGGISFLIKDFYQANKYANMYEVFYADYKNKQMGLEEFQKLATFEIYTGKFNYTWIYWFLVQPVLSSVLGLVAFSIARSGLGVLQGTSTVSADITIQSVYLYGVFTYLAGFSSHKFIAWLDRLADKIFSMTLPEKAQADKVAIKQASAYERGNLRENIQDENVPSDSVDSTKESGKIVEQSPVTGFETVKLEISKSDSATGKPIKLKPIR